MIFTKDNNLAADQLDFGRVCQLLRRDKYSWDEPSEVSRLVKWIRGLVRKGGEKWVYENRDRLSHSWMTKERFHFGLAKADKVRIVEALKKEGRDSTASEWVNESLGGKYA